MVKISVRALIPGKPLDGPLFDARGRLLLAVGNTLTHDMIVSLLYSGTKFAYLGEWNADEVDDLENASPVANYRREARALMNSLAAEVEALISSPDELDVLPEGEPFADSVDHSLQMRRSDKRIKEWRATCHGGVAFVENVIRGEIDNDRVADGAVELVAKVVDLFSKDRSLLLAFTNLRDASDYHYQHAFNSAVIAINTATALGYNLAQVREVGVAALFKDVGMAMVPEQVLLAPRVLAPFEFVDVQKHTMLGLYILERIIGLPASTRLTMYQHHERADGSGYTQRRERMWIHRFAQIASVADVYDALTSARPWRPAYAPYLAMEAVIKQANKGRFSSEIVRGLLRYLSLFPIGSFVRLSNLEIGKVVHSNGDSVDRPVVSVLVDAEGRPHSAPQLRNLLEEEDLRVETYLKSVEGIGTDTGF